MNLVAINQAQLAYGGYKFASAFFLSQIQRDITMESVDLPFVRGGYAPPAKPGKKTFTVSGYLGAGGAILDSNGQQILTSDALQSEIDRMTPYFFQGTQPFQFMYGSVSRFCLAQAQSPKVTFQTGAGYRWAQIDFNFVALDPCEYSYAQHSQNVQCTTTGGSISANFSNAGNFRTYPVITLSFQSACTNPSILITPPMGGTIGFTLSGTFATTDSVVIVCDPLTLPSSSTPNGGRSLQYNGASDWALLSLPVTNTLPAANGIPNTEFLPFLDPGANSVAVSATSGQFTAQLQWRDAWI